LHDGKKLELVIDLKQKVMVESPLSFNLGSLIYKIRMQKKVWVELLAEYEPENMMAKDNIDKVC
jgi:hypothetical protein